MWNDGQVHWSNVYTTFRSRLDACGRSRRSGQEAFRSTAAGQNEFSRTSYVRTKFYIAAGLLVGFL